MGEIHRTESGRAITYCLVPRALAPKLLEPLRSQFAFDPAVEVVVERRADERRQTAERRRAPEETVTDRRRILGAAGRRVGERRAAQVPAASQPPPLPRRFARYADRLVFVERIQPSTQRLEDDVAARFVVRFQAGDRDVFEELYLQYFNAVYTYLRVIFRDDPHQVEDLTQQVFTNALGALERYERRRQPFRAWLFTIVRNLALDELRRGSRSDVTDPASFTGGHEPATPPDANLDALSWISDRELLLLIERLPMAQRQVLVLRHMLDLATADIARILDRRPDDVRKLDHRARRFLEERLTALGRAPAARKPLKWRGHTRWMPVGRARRYALTR